MSRHEGVSCDACLKSSFRGRRYKCLVCYDYDLCETCHEEGVTTTRHTTEHPMQCILTRMDFQIYYGGEGVTIEQPQSLTCPYCGKHGYTEHSLLEHVTNEHQDVSNEVVCPICASVPGGEPNFVTDDFNSHINYEHRSLVSGSNNTSAATNRSNAAPAIDLDEPTSIGTLGNSSSHTAVSGSGRTTGMRRMQYRGRGMGRAMPGRNLTFGSVGSGLFPTSRESMDPIAELLSQLTGGRRHGATSATSAPSSGTSRQQQPATSQNQWSGLAEESNRTTSRRTRTSNTSSIPPSNPSTVAAVAAHLASQQGGGSTTASQPGSSGTTPNPRLLYGSIISGNAPVGISSHHDAVRVLVDSTQSSANTSTAQQQAASNYFGGAAYSASAAVNGNPVSSNQHQTFGSVLTDGGSSNTASGSSSQFLLSRLCESEKQKDSSAEAGDAWSHAFIRELLLSSLSLTSPESSPSPPSPSVTSLPAVETSSEEPQQTEKVETSTVATQTPQTPPPPINTKPIVPPAFKGRKPVVMRPTGAVTKRPPNSYTQQSGGRNPGSNPQQTNIGNQGNFGGGGGGTGGGGGSSSTSTLVGVSPPGVGVVGGAATQTPRGMGGKKMNAVVGGPPPEPRAANEPPPPL